MSLTLFGTLGREGEGLALVSVSPEAPSSEHPFARVLEVLPST